MKTPFRSLLILCALLAATLGLHAQPALKIVTVDLNRLLENYYRTQDQVAKLKEQSSKAQESYNLLQKEYEKLVAEFKELQDQSNTPILTDEAKKAAQENLQTKFGEVRAKEQDLQAFRVNTDNEMKKRINTYQQMFLEEITKVVSDLAKKKGATLVVNKSAAQIGPVIYADAGYDITEEALTEINKDKPVTLNVPGITPK